MDLRAAIGNSVEQHDKTQQKSGGPIAGSMANATQVGASTGPEFADRTRPEACWKLNASQFRS
jgi:hypothetical protein